MEKSHQILLFYLGKLMNKVSYLKFQKFINENETKWLLGSFRSSGDPSDASGDQWGRGEANTFVIPCPCKRTAPKEEQIISIYDTQDCASILCKLNTGGWKI